MLTAHYRPLPHGLGTLPARLASFIDHEVTNPAPLPNEPQTASAGAGPVQMNRGGHDLPVYAGPWSTFQAVASTGHLLSAWA